MRELNVSNKVINEILRAKENKRLMHVYLFYGSDETTMRDTAFVFAANLYCGCLSCPLCESILDDNHLNVKYVGIEDDKNIITKEQINSITDEFMQTSLIEGPRIYIIDGIDTSSVAAQNSLLKFIEDPAMQDEVYGVLIAKSIDNVLPTIRSRCGLMHFKSLTKEEVTDLLEEDYSADDAFILGTLAKNKTDAKKIFIDSSYQTLKEMLYGFLDLNNPKDAVLFYLSNARISNDLLQSFLKLLISAYESSLYKRKLISSPIYDKIDMINKRFSLKEREKRLENLLDLEIKTHYNVITKNVLHELIVLFF